MKALIVDDEEPALIHLERLLRMDGRFEIAGMYMSAKECLEHLAKSPVDIIFLDIGMPQMNGLEAAERIQALDSKAKIVYTTAYSEYAVDAFELNALDYLLKPVDSVRMAKTVDRVIEYLKLANKKESRPAIKPDIRCFKRLEVIVDSQPGEPLRWRTRKAQELFAYLLHLEGNWVPKERLMEVLWLEQEQDKAVTYLHHSISRIRSLLKKANVPITIEYADESYRLLCNNLQTDVQLFERGLSTSNFNFQDNWEYYTQLLELYRGDYLEDYDYEWAKNRRNDLQQRYLSLLLGMINYELAEGREWSAIQHLHAILEKDPYNETFCALLLSAYARTGDRKKLEQCYASFTALLEQELGVQPEAPFQDHYERLLGEMQ